MQEKQIAIHKLTLPTTITPTRHDNVKIMNNTSLIKLDLSIVTPSWDVVIHNSILITPTTKQEMKNAPPNTLLSPTVPLLLDRVNDMILEKTSLAPFPRGRRVVPAIAGERFMTLDKPSAQGQKYSAAVLPNK
uniref:Putative ovule protein n=1 Tax=Solanum chacoense TaxID=4108 RepID=A0A0V0H1K4_SOLCH